MARRPHTCPSCKGKKPAKDDCDTCNRTGVVWEPDDPTEGNVVGGEAEDHMDLTYRPAR